LKSRPFLLEAESLTKRYDGKVALEDVALDIRGGEVLALTGENGAGKSTLVGILTGTLAPDAGRIRIDGVDVAIRSPADARNLGIVAVHQDFDLASNMTVAENLVLGNEPQWIRAFVDRRRQYETAAGLLALVGLDVDPESPVGRLSAAERQLVAIARTLRSAVRLLVLDEPTSTLPAVDIERLLATIECQRNAGTAVLFISHKLDEVLRISDRVSVFRDGRNAGTLHAADTSAAQIVSLMVGRSLPRREQRNDAASGDLLLQVRGVRARGLSGAVDFHLHRGEILGLYGLKGAGRIDLLRALFGLPAPDSGELRVNNRTVRIRSPRDAIRHGIGWVCRDRKELGLFGNFDVGENLSIAALDSLSRGGVLSRRSERCAVEGFIRQLAIKTDGMTQAITALSGGNQQKVLLARWLLCRPRILMLDEPTVGIDVGAKSEVYELIRQLAADGLGIILASSELPEVLTLSDRLLVMRDGAITGELARKHASEARVMALIHAGSLPAAADGNAVSA
jgi:ABC-type sugar transport system ATPase subunit